MAAAGSYPAPPRASPGPVSTAPRPPAMRQHRPFRTASGPVRALYALQAHVALTGVEAATLLAVTLALAAGLALRAYQGPQAPAAGAALFPADSARAAPHLPG